MINRWAVVRCEVLEVRIKPGVEIVVLKVSHVAQKCRDRHRFFLNFESPEDAVDSFEIVRSLNCKCEFLVRLQEYLEGVRFPWNTDMQFFLFKVSSVII